jgi:hypothetical protein
MKELCNLEIEKDAIISHKTIENDSLIIELKGGITLFIYKNTFGIFLSNTIKTKEFESVDLFKITLVEDDLSTIMENIQGMTIN